MHPSSNRIPRTTVVFSSLRFYSSLLSSFPNSPSSNTLIRLYTNVKEFVHRAY